MADFIKVGFIDVYNAYGYHRRLKVNNPKELWKLFGKDNRAIKLKGFPLITITNLKLVSDTVYIDGTVDYKIVRNQEKRLEMFRKMVDFYRMA